MNPLLLLLLLGGGLAVFAAGGSSGGSLGALPNVLYFRPKSMESYIRQATEKGDRLVAERNANEIIGFAVTDESERLLSPDLTLFAEQHPEFIFTVQNFSGIDAVEIPGLVMIRSGFQTGRVQEKVIAQGLTPSQFENQFPQIKRDILEAIGRA